MQVCKYFELKHFLPKSYLAQTFANRAYSAACASSELLRACLALNEVLFVPSELKWQDWKYSASQFSLRSHFASHYLSVPGRRIWENGCICKSTHWSKDMCMDKRWGLKYMSNDHKHELMHVVNEVTPTEACSSGDGKGGFAASTP